MKKILYIEDNDEYRNLLMKELVKHGYFVDGVSDPLLAVGKLANGSYDIILSDLRLPNVDGVTIAETLRQIDPGIGIMILTADPDEVTEIQAIENSVDRYISKDKPISVIIKYIDSIIESRIDRSETTQYIMSRTENIIMDMKEHRVSKEGKLIDLTPKEYELLYIFLTNKNKVMTREDLIDLAWHEPTELIEERLVDSHIKRLRIKLNTYSIATVRGFGYRWNEVNDA